MFSFSANYLFLLSWTECLSYAEFSMQDLDAKHVYQTRDLTRAQLIRPRTAYCLAGKVNGTNKRSLAIESVRPDSKFAGFSTIPVPADGAGGWTIG